MNEDKKNFFHIPTWALIALSVLCFLSALHNSYMFLNLESLSTVTMNGVKITSSSPGYDLVIEDMKKTYVVTTIFTILLAFMFGFFAVRRKKTNIDQLTSH